MFLSNKVFLFFRAERRKHSWALAGEKRDGGTETSGAQLLKAAVLVARLLHGPPDSDLVRTERVRSEIRNPNLKFSN